MKKIHFLIYINDNKFFLLNLKNNKIINQQFESLKESLIINEQLFEKELNKFFTKNNIPISIFGYNTCFIKNKDLNSVILNKYIELFNEYFRNIELINIEDILNKKENTSYFNINDTYLEYFYEKKNKINLIKVENTLFNNNINKMIGYLFSNIYKPKKIVVYGNSNKITRIVEKLIHYYKVTTTFSEFSENYILEEYKKI